LAALMDDRHEEHGLVAILAGILVIILARAGVGGRGAGRAVMVAAIILLLASHLYKRGQCPRVAAASHELLATDSVCGPPDSSFHLTRLRTRHGSRT